MLGQLVTRLFEGAFGADDVDGDRVGPIDGATASGVNTAAGWVRTLGIRCFLRKDLTKAICDPAGSDTLT